MKFLLLLTVFAGPVMGSHEIVTLCPTWECAQSTINGAYVSPATRRIRVWRQKDYAPLKTSGVPLWPPVIDWEPS